MILRVYRAITHEGKQAQFTAFLKETAIPTLEGWDGMEEMTVGWPHETSPCEFSLVMKWRDLDALISFTGNRWNEAVVHPDEAHLLVTSYVSHFELD